MTTAKQDIPTFGFDSIEPPRYEKLQSCVHCGFCVPYCPTYKVLGIETESPRGRLYLMKAVSNGEIDIGDGFVEHMELCLNCRACEAVCPSGVKFGEVMEATRGQIERKYSRPLTEKIARRVILNHVFPHPWRLNLLFSGLRFYQKLGLRKLLKATGIKRRLPLNIGNTEEMFPVIPGRFFEPPPDEVVKPISEKRFRVGFFSGCVMRSVFAEVNYATVRILARNGCEVVIPKNQICCAAVHTHNGVRETARKMARHNIDVFERAKVDYIIINSAGCGATLKEYRLLLKHDPEYSEKARIFSQKMRDINEFLVEIDFDRRLGEIRRRVTYQDPCHLVHVQKIRKQPREIITAIPGIELVEMNESDTCCGGAGTYSIFQYDLSMEILERKIANLMATNADMLVTSNPPCLLQLYLGKQRSKQGFDIVHVAELMDRAYSLHPDFQPYEHQIRW